MSDGPARPGPAPAAASPGSPQPPDQRPPAAYRRGCDCCAEPLIRLPHVYVHDGRPEVLYLCPDCDSDAALP